MAMRVIVVGLALGGLIEVRRRNALVMSAGVIGFGGKAPRRLSLVEGKKSGSRVAWIC